jgi:hypothetical protein
MPKANIKELFVTTVGISLIYVTKTGMKKPKRRPVVPPDNVKMRVSVRN